MFLTREQVRLLTGTADKGRQAEVLRRERVRFTLDWNGRPVVPVSAVEGTAPASNEQQQWTPKMLSGKAA
jgi:hypothetical protein